MPILYSYYRSSCSYRVRIALHLKSVEFDYRAVHLVKEGGEQFKEEYVNLNPHSQVPYFIDGEFKCSQSVAIIKYLDENWTQGPKLMSQDKCQSALELERVELINSGIQPIQNLGVLKELESRFKAQPEDKKQWSKLWIEKGFHSLERLLEESSGQYSMGDKVTVVDCFLVPQVYNAKRFEVDMGQYPNISRVDQNCLSLESFKKAHPSEQVDAE